MATTTADEVPYYVLELENGHTKAVFTVPQELAESIMSHPILCRGSSFALQLDAVSQRVGANPTTSFLCTEYFSPEPEDTASDISRRLAIRVSENSDQVVAGVFGGLK